MLRLENVTFCYGKNKILDNITAELNKGLTVLLGPNGCGKSTLLRVMAGHLKGQGRCLLSGAEVSKISPVRRARSMAYVSQNGYIASDITVKQAVLLGRYCYVGMLASYKDADKLAAQDAMRACGIEHLKERSVLALSGGELQRVLLARALAQIEKGEVLLLDEPITGLDIRYQLELMSTVKRISKEKCVVAVLHDAALAAQYADRVIVLAEGAIYADGKPQDVLNKEVFRHAWGINGEIKKGENGYYIDIII